MPCQNDISEHQVNRSIVVQRYATNNEQMAICGGWPMKHKGYNCRVLKESKENDTQVFVNIDRGNEYARGWVDKADIEDYSYIQILMNREVLDDL